MLNVPVLETERLVLRPWKPESDAEAVFAYASLVEATQYMLFDTHRDIDDSHAFLEWTKTSGEHAYAITQRENDSPIGGCGIMPTLAHSKGELGYILHPEHWNKGLGTEVAKALIRYGFETLGLNRIYARADVRNPASQQVMLKSGMIVEGTLREDLSVRGEMVSLVYCSILRSEYFERATRIQDDYKVEII